MSNLEMIALMLVAHFLADFPLQGEYLTRAKNHLAPIAGTPWIIALLAHATIHGGAVGLVTGSTALGLAELVVHAGIDFAKSDGRISFTTDQALHVACKVAWLVCFVAAKSAEVTP